MSEVTIVTCDECGAQRESDQSYVKWPGRFYIEHEGKYETYNLCTWKCIADFATAMAEGENTQMTAVSSV